MGERGEAHRLWKKLSEEDELLLGIMEGYADAVIPPLSYFSSNADTSSVSFSKRRQRSCPEHLSRERERRETMTEKFSLLQSMLPTLSDAHKLAPKEKIVEDTVNYIKFLEGEKAILEGLQKKLQKKVPNKVVMRPVFSRCGNYPKVRVSGGATFLEIKLPFARGSVAKIVEVLDKHGVEVLEARICVDDMRMLTFTATVMLVIGSSVEMIVEEISTL